jgi:hypothetical protein
MPDRKHVPELDDAPIDYDAILRANAARIFSEVDLEKRSEALSELWAEDGLLIEPDKVLTGREAISGSVGELLRMLPSGTTFSPIGPAVGHHGIGRLRWQAIGSDGSPGPVSGTDIAFIEGGRISRLYVILDPPA